MVIFLRDGIGGRLKPKPEPKPETKPEDARQRPTFIAFGLKKRDGAWHAIAVRIRGREVLDERVLDSSTWIEVAEDALSRATYDFNHFELSPFKEVPA